MHHRSSENVSARQHRRVAGTALEIIKTFIISNTGSGGAKRWSARQSWHRYSIFLGLAAVATALLALPGAALACVNSCPGGSIGVNGDGFPFCQGGSSNGQLVCTGGGSGGSGGGGTSKRLIPLPAVPFGGGGGFDPNDMPLRVVGEWFQGLAGGGPNPLPVAPGAGVAQLGGPVNATPVGLTMYSSGALSGLYGTGDLFSVHNSGYRLSDSTGAIAPGSQLPGYHSTEGGGGFNLLADGTSFIGANTNQHLLFGLNFDYQRANTSWGTSALTPGLSNAGSDRDDIYTLTGSVGYMANGFYLNGLASYDWSHAGITNNTGTPGAQGSTNGQGYTLTATAGYLFPLLNTTGVSTSAIPTKAPPAPRYGGYALFFDVNGHIGYQKQWEDGFTDSTGFVYGTEQLSYTDLGAQANLIAVMPSAGFSWMPFVGVSVDQQIGFSHTFDIPVQAVSAPDTFFIGQNTTFWGVQGGVNIINRAGLKAGLNGFYEASGDTQIAGGGAFIRIPFYYDQVPAADSGIREVRK